MVILNVASSNDTFYNLRKVHIKAERLQFQMPLESLNSELYQIEKSINYCVVSSFSNCRIRIKMDQRKYPCSHQTNRNE